MGNLIGDKRSIIDEDTQGIIDSTRKEIEYQIERSNWIRAKIKKCNEEADRFLRDGEEKEARRVLDERKKLYGDLAQNYGMTARLKTILDEAEKMKNISDVKGKEDAWAVLLGRCQKKADPLTMLEKYIGDQQFREVIGRDNEEPRYVSDSSDEEPDELDELLLEIKQKVHADKIHDNIKTPPNTVGSEKVSKKKPVKNQDDDVSTILAELMN